MRANQTCPEWARLSGNKHCHYMSIRALMAFSHHCYNFVFIKLITNRFFYFFMLCVIVCQVLEPVTYIWHKEKQQNSLCSDNWITKTMVQWIRDRMCYESKRCIDVYSTYIRRQFLKLLPNRYFPRVWFQVKDNHSVHTDNENVYDCPSRECIVCGPLRSMNNRYNKCNEYTIKKKTLIQIDYVC